MNFRLKCLGKSNQKNFHGAERPRNGFRPKVLRNVGSGSRKR